VEEHTNADVHGRRIGVRVSGARDGQSRHLIHLAAVLDNWDPRVVDDFAAEHHVITFDNRGVGASSGKPATSIEQMATDAITFIKAMGFEQVDLFGFSMGGMIAQEIALMEPPLVRKMSIAGTGPAGGEGISKALEFLAR
jgi:pimeloyl-ACP methyl ester carboxylesterase